MSQIQDFSQTALAFILHNNMIFDAAVLFCHMFAECRIQSKKPLHVLLQEIKEHAFLSQTCMLDRLCHSAGKLSCRQRLPGSNIQIYLLRLIKQTDQIRGKRRINRCLAADRSICCRKQRRRIIDKRHTSSIGACNKARKIRYNTSTHSDDPAVSAILLRKHRILYDLLCLTRLTLLPCREGKYIHNKSIIFKLARDRLCIKLLHFTVRDHCELLSAA